MTLKGFKSDLIDMAQMFLPAIFIAWFLTTFIMANSIVPSSSMESTIMTGSRLIGSRLAYSFGEMPQRGEIIIFEFPDNPDVYYVKRLIGMPGDKVEIVEDENDPGFGYVMINGEKYEEPYLNGKMEVTSNQVFEVPEGSYFFMGDNRNRSHDARYWENTYVKEDALVAKVLFQYWKGFKKLY